MAINWAATDREVIGRIVEEARLGKGWGKEKAAREAGVSSQTLKRIEDGLGTQDAKLAAVIRAMGVQLKVPGTGAGEVVILGGDAPMRSVVVTDESPDDERHVASSGHPVQTSVGGPAHDAEQYVTSVGERVESGITNEDLLREIQRSRAEYDQLRAAVRDVSERVAQLEERDS